MQYLVYIVAGLGAGVATGFAGLSAAAVITPMLVTFLGFDAYQAVGIALASDVLASGVSAWTYHRHKNLDVKNGLVMMVTTLLFTLVGSWAGSLFPQRALGDMSVYMTMLLGLKFIVKPVMQASEKNRSRTARQKVLLSLAFGVGIGMICGFIGAGGGMMLLLVLTSALGYDLKTAVGTSVFIMTFTALTGAVSHFAIGGGGDLAALFVCVAATFAGAQIAARYANRAAPATLNRVTGVVLLLLGGGMLLVKKFG